MREGIFSASTKAVVKKEFLSVLKDKRSRMILVLPVVMYIILFGYIASFNLERIPYAVCDLSHSAVSAELVRAIEAGGLFRRQATLTSVAEVNRAVEENDALIVAVIAPDFARRLAEGREAPVEVIVDGRNSTTAQLAAGYLSTVAANFNAEYFGAAPKLTLRLLYNVNNITQWFIMPGLVLMIGMLQTVVLAALAISREREQGTFEQLSVTPLTTGQILFAKTLVPCVIGAFQGGLILAACLWWFEIPFAGRFSQLLVIDAVFLLAVVGLGLAISAAAKTMQQALLMVIVFLVPMVLLGGLFTPVENMPDWIQALTWADPLRFGLVAIRRTYLTGAGWADIAQALWLAALMACAALPAAYWFCRRRL